MALTCYCLVNFGFVLNDVPIIKKTKNVYIFFIRKIM